MAKLIESATTAELLNNPSVQQVLDSAWADSLASDPVERHEEGGWIYQNTMTRGVTLHESRVYLSFSLMQKVKTN